MTLYDITHTLSGQTPPWPGDSVFLRRPTWRMADGASVNLSQVSMSPHNGTHADAPFHYDDQGATMDRVDPARFIGRCRLVALEGRRAIGVADLADLGLHGVERLLVRTGSVPVPSQFNPGFTYFEPAAIRFLASHGVRLIGTDAHSMDPFDSTDLPSHRTCAELDVLILENLKLDGVPAGEYELIALPLKIVGGDGSPVRAVLRTLD